MRPRRLILAFILALILTTLYILLCFATNNLRNLMGWQDNGFTAWVVLVLVAFRWWRIRRIWQGGLAYAVCNAIAWWAFKQHREDLRLVFDRLGSAILWFTILDGDGTWRRRLWGKLKSIGLTAVNAASFRRQTKEVLT